MWSAPNRAPPDSSTSMTYRVTPSYPKPQNPRPGIRRVPPAGRAVRLRPRLKQPGPTPREPRAQARASRCRLYVRVEPVRRAGSREPVAECVTAKQRDRGCGDDVGVRAIGTRMPTDVESGGRHFLSAYAASRSLLARSALRSRRASRRTTRWSSARFVRLSRPGSR